jgi:hypothetical protein
MNYILTKYQSRAITYRFYHNGKKINKKTPIDLSANPVVELIEYNYILDNRVWWIFILFITIIGVLGSAFPSEEEAGRTSIKSKTIKLIDPQQEIITLYFNKNSDIQKVSGVLGCEVLKESEEESLKAKRRIKVWRGSVIFILLLFLFLITGALIYYILTR